MRLIVTGGCGYKGSVLVPKLLAAGHLVRVLDVQWFGNFLVPHSRLKIICGDIRDQKFPIGATDAMIHLAAVANDPAGDLDPAVTLAINATATANLAARCIEAGVKQFIYASSSSVYGASDAPEVTETSTLVPLSEYNRTKDIAERSLLEYADRMCVQILRPATVCGFSPRFRADTLVNNLTLKALTDGKLHLLSPDLYRPHIHIDDITNAYIFMLGRPDLSGIYNAGFENFTIRQVAAMVAERTGVSITEAQGSLDKRSYRINSDKLLATGFKPTKTVANAIDEMIEKFNAGHLRDEERWHNLRLTPKAA